MKISDVIQNLTAILEKEGDLRILLDDSTGNTFEATKVQVTEGPYELKDQRKIYSYDSKMVVIN